MDRPSPVPSPAPICAYSVGRVAAMVRALIWRDQTLVRMGTPKAFFTEAVADRSRAPPETRQVPWRYMNCEKAKCVAAGATMTHSSLAILLALIRRSDVGGAIRPWILRLERKKRWAAERAAIQAEVARAKETVDLVRMARTVTRLDALEAEIEAVERTTQPPVIRF
jgi:hypothetical protein